MSEAEIAAAYETFGALVIRRCRRILGNDAAAEDTLQEVFVRVMHHWPAFAAADSRLAWLYRVADNCCFDQLRRLKRGPFESIKSDVPDPPTQAPLEDRDVVLRFLARFDEQVQRIAVLHYVDGMSQEEIAAVIGVSRQTIYNKLTLLKERAAILRRSLLGGAS